MPAPVLSITRRLRSTPFSERVNAAGVRAFTTYNNMLLPTVFRTVELDYRHLKTHVQVWDVSCERQIEVIGPDAALLMQRLTPRNLTKMKVGQCFYTPIVNQAGGMLNDPVTLKLAENHFWISIADSDLLLWVMGLAVGGNYDVNISEPDISPLAVQGPKADILMERVFGAEVLDVRFFRFGRFDFCGREMIISRSGYSKQGGYEIYVNGTDMGAPVWDALFDAGEDLQVQAGCPNLIERIESGLLSYGNDMTSENTPHECGLGRLCHTDIVRDCIGYDALRKEEVVGPSRQIRSFAIAGTALPPCVGKWPVYWGNTHVGDITSAAWSPDFKTNVALGMVDRSCWVDGMCLEVQTPIGLKSTIVYENCFADRQQPLHSFPEEVQ